MTTEPEAVQLARRIIASGYIHDSGPRIDVLARAVLDQHAEIERLRTALTDAAHSYLGVAASIGRGSPESDAAKATTAWLRIATGK